MKTDSFFNNKYVLYIVVFLTVTNLFGYLMVQNTEAILFMIITGYLTTYFSKNMIIVLLVSLLTTNLLVSLHNLDNKQIVENMASASSNRARRRRRRAAPRAATAALDEDMATGAPSKFDFGSNIEGAHDSMDKLLKSGLSGKDTKALMAQQQQMMENLKHFEPMMSKATTILEKFDPEALANLTKSFGGMGGMSNILGGGNNRKKK